MTGSGRTAIDDATDDLYFETVAKKRDGAETNGETITKTNARVVVKSGETIESRDEHCYAVAYEAAIANLSEWLRVLLGNLQLYFRVCCSEELDELELHCREPVHEKLVSPYNIYRPNNLDCFQNDKRDSMAQTIVYYFESKICALHTQKVKEAVVWKKYFAVALYARLLHYLDFPHNYTQEYCYAQVEKAQYTLRFEQENKTHCMLQVADYHHSV